MLFVLNTFVIILFSSITMQNKVHVSSPFCCTMRSRRHRHWLQNNVTVTSLKQKLTSKIN